MSLKQSVLGIFGIIGALVLGGCSSSLTTSVKTGDTEVSTNDTKVMVTTKDGEKDTEMKKEVVMPKKNIVVIFDASGSMNEILNGEKKIDIAKKSLDAYIDSISSDVNMSLLAYGHVGSNKVADKAISCSTVEEKYFLGPVNPAVIKEKVRTISAKGWTPITHALEKANAILATHPGDENRILLVSDGEETCGGNPLEIARKVRTGNARVDVIGFDVKGAVAEELKNISVQGGGGYISVKSANDFNVVIKNGTLNAITPDSMVSVGDNGAVSVQTDAANIKLDSGAVDIKGSGTDIQVKPGEMPKINGVPDNIPGL